jgi:phenylalanyl-tRNA synthetase beta chain
MNVSTYVLSQYISLPSNMREFRLLLDDLGLEVKKQEPRHNSEQTPLYTETDIVFNLELLANRGDHHCYAGIAREISGRTGQKICLPEYTDIKIGEGPEIIVESDLCLRYSLLEMTLDGDEISFSEQVLAPLTAAGIHSITAPIDATNLCNIEIGQPTHTFDADTVVGKVTVRMSQIGEMAWPLFFEKPIELNRPVLVIADDEKILAIAGVIGCEESKTTDLTKRIYVESATFDPVSTRKAGRILGVHTDSLARFERGADPDMPLKGIGRVVHLLETHTNWKRTSPCSYSANWSAPLRVLELPITATQAFLDIQISKEDISERLLRYGFSCKEQVRRHIDDIQEGYIDVIVPSHRIWDVDRIADLHEELAKSIGYNNTPISLPSITKGTLPSREYKIKEEIEDVLIGKGFYEVITDGFYSRAQREKCGIDENHPLYHHVETINALARGYSLLKNNCFIHAIDALHRNINQHMKDLKIYEWTRTFHLNEEAENGVCDERNVLWGLVNGKEKESRWLGKVRICDVYTLKNMLEEISTQQGLQLSLQSAHNDYPISSFLHPYRQASILYQGKVVGIIGEIHPQILVNHKIKKQRPCYFEIDEDVLYLGNSKQDYVVPPTHMDLERTITFALPLQIESAKISSILEAHQAKVWVVDRFDFMEEEQPFRAITYRLAFSNEDGSRSADSVNQILQGCIETVLENFGKQGVVHR